MMEGMSRIAALVVGGVIAASAGLGASDPLSPMLADAFQQKLLVVVRNGGTASRFPRSTPIAEGELNSYLRFRAGDQLPAGVTEPVITLVGQGRVVASAIVDLDVIRLKQGNKGGWFDPTSYLSGKLPVSTTGAVVSADGLAHFSLESVEVSGLPVPKRLLQEIVSYYTKTADRPNGVSLDDSFPLPAQIRRLDVEAGRAIVIQ